MDLALDQGSEKLYWSTRNRKIRRANLDGSDVEDLLVRQAPSYDDIALDLANGKLYWVSWISRRIQRANLDGSQIEDVVDGVERPQGLEIDTVNSKIYWATWTNGSAAIRRANLDGSMVEDVLTGLGFVADLAPIINNKLYWVEEANTIHRANLDGTELEIVFEHDGFWTGELTIHSSGELLFWSDGTGIAMVDLTRPESEKRYLTTHNPFVSTVILDEIKNNLYWGDNSVFRLDLDGSDIETVVPSSLGGVRGVAVDEMEGKMYWIGRTLQKADLDGANHKVVFSDRNFFASPNDIALDVVEKWLYITDRGSSTISRVRFDGTEWEWLLRDSQTNSPQHIALDVDAGKMYWTGGRPSVHNPNTRTISRANLDGSEIETLVDSLAAPMGIALDIPAGKMYWTDQQSLKISRADLDGSEVEDLITEGLIQPRGIDLDVARGKMYWADGSILRRANLDGSEMEDVAFGERVEDVALYIDPTYVSIDTDTPTASGIFVEPAYPNPFHSSTTLHVTALEPTPARILLYNALGQPVRVLHDGILAGQHTIQVDRHTPAAGVYWVQVQSNRFSYVIRSVVVLD